MIRTKQDLKEYIEADLSVQPAPKSWFKRYRRKQIRMKIFLRKSEYHYNNRNKSFIHRLLYTYWWSRCKRIQDSFCTEICMNVFGKGLTIWHGERIITNPHARVGDYCSITSGVVIAQAHDEYPVIGDYVELMIDSKVLGGVTVADHGRIGANALVIKNINQCTTTWAGCPAKKINDQGTIENPVPKCY